MDTWRMRSASHEETHSVSCNQQQFPLWSFLFFSPLFFPPKMILCLRRQEAARAAFVIHCICTNDGQAPLYIWSGSFWMIPLLCFPLSHIFKAPTIASAISFGSRGNRPLESTSIQMNFYETHQKNYGPASVTRLGGFHMAARLGHPMRR
jgi:hypothetical protein